MKDLIPSISKEKEAEIINSYSSILQEYKFLRVNGFAPELALELMKIKQMTISNQIEGK
ncbi:MAG: hypothetical protein GX306_13025 [Clostridiales bacterium]|nr:hypothetical protein [Clostridiales bacterium]